MVSCLKRVDTSDGNNYTKEPLIKEFKPTLIEKLLLLYGNQLSYLILVSSYNISLLKDRTLNLDS